MRLALIAEATAEPGFVQLSFLDALTSADPGARPPTPAMIRVLALAAARSDGEVTSGSLNLGAFSALCVAMSGRGLVRSVSGIVTITTTGRAAVLTAEGRN